MKIAQNRKKGMKIGTEQEKRDENRHRIGKRDENST